MIGLNYRKQLSQHLRLPNTNVLTGYANEVGETFRALIHVQWVRLSYGVASSYVLADALHKGWIVYKKPGESMNQRSFSAAIAFTDTLIWQGFASVIIPGFTINRICYLTGLGLKHATRLPSPVRKWGTTAIGLGCIPFIVRPIDRTVDIVMDKSLRVWYGHHPKMATNERQKTELAESKDS